jgi:hypothetical protein
MPHFLGLWGQKEVQHPLHKLAFTALLCLEAVSPRQHFLATGSPKILYQNLLFKFMHSPSLCTVSSTVNQWKDISEFQLYLSWGTPLHIKQKRAMQII